MNGRRWRYVILALLVGIGAGLLMEHVRPRPAPSRPPARRPAPSGGHPTPDLPGLEDAVPMRWEDWGLVGLSRDGLDIDDEGRR